MRFYAFTENLTHTAFLFESRWRFRSSRVALPVTNICCITAGSLRWQFQSTPPRRGRPDRRPASTSPDSFNPRPAKGRRLSRSCQIACALVSIHAPAKGATPPLVVIAEAEQSLALIWKGRRERIVTWGHRFHDRADGFFEIDPEAVTHSAPVQERRSGHPAADRA